VISVRDAILDEPVSGSVALYRHATTFSYRSTSLDEYGIATFTLVDANDAGLPYYARVTSSGRTTITIDGIIVAGGLTTYRDLSMWPNRGTLEIISKDAVTNAPISGSISLYRHGTTYSYRSSAFGTDGIATLSLVDINSAAQPYRVALTSSGYETLTVDGLTISGAAKTSLPSRLWPSNGVISGVVTNSLGTPINASVALYRHNTSYSFRSTTAASDGSFSMTGVPANAFDEPYRLVFSRTGYSSATVSNVFVHSGTTTNIDAVCRTDTPTTTALSSPQPGAVAGVARDILTGAPLAGARVSLHRAGSAERQVFADTEGAFEFSDVLWGLGYSLHVESDGYVNYSISGLAVRGGRTTYLQPELAPVYGSIAGRLVASIPEAPGARHSISVSSSPQHAGAVQGSGVFTEGQVITVVATPAAGYAFSGWTEDGELVSSNDSYVFTVTRPRTLVANFEPLSVVISTEVSPASSGSVSGAAAYDYAATVTLVASATEPFVFHRWMEDGVQVSTDPVYSFTATHARHLVAWFRQFAQADLNQDGRVDLLDLVILAQKYRLTSQDAGWIPEYDLNGDGIIDIYDMAAVARAIEP
jgi:hypothetical protein